MTSTHSIRYVYHVCPVLSVSVRTFPDSPDLGDYEEIFLEQHSRNICGERKIAKKKCLFTETTQQMHCALGFFFVFLQKACVFLLG